jgi:hypothetical protein
MSSATKNKGDNDEPTAGRSLRRSPLSGSDRLAQSNRSARRPLIAPLLTPLSSACPSVRPSVRLCTAVVFPSRQSQSATLFFLHGLGDSARGGWSDVVPEVSGSASAAQRRGRETKCSAGQCSAAQCAALRSGPAAPVCGQSFFSRGENNSSGRLQRKAEQRHCSARTCSDSYRWCALLLFCLSVSAPLSESESRSARRAESARHAQRRNENAVVVSYHAKCAATAVAAASEIASDS